MKNRIIKSKLPVRGNLSLKRYFTQEEIDAVSQNVVISSQYGNSVEFVMRSEAVLSAIYHLIKALI